MKAQLSDPERDIGVLAVHSFDKATKVAGVMGAVDHEHAGNADHAVHGPHGDRIETVFDQHLSTTARGQKAPTRRTARRRPHQRRIAEVRHGAAEVVFPNKGIGINAHQKFCLAGIKTRV